MFLAYKHLKLKQNSKNIYLDIYGYTCMYSFQEYIKHSSNLSSYIILRVWAREARTKQPSSKLNFNYKFLLLRRWKLAKNSFVKWLFKVESWVLLFFLIFYFLFFVYACTECRAMLSFLVYTDRLNAFKIYRRWGGQGVYEYIQCGLGLRASKEIYISIRSAIHKKNM